uniref:Uncharacterized protein n=1 Tax=Solanum tuberosum TaxID=4113 RepID=M1BQA2_SOLTU
MRKYKLSFTGDCLQLKGRNTGDTGQPAGSSTTPRNHIYMVARPQHSHASHMCSQSVNALVLRHRLTYADAVSKPTNVPCASTEAEHIVASSSTFELGIQQNRDNVLAQEQTSHRNLRRRTRYAEMSPHRKELLLSQLREKRAASKRQKSLLQSNNTAALTITTSSLSPPQC